MSLRMVDHPLAQHVLAGLRDRHTTPDRFRQLADTLSTILILEATRDLPVRATSVETPIETASAHVLAEPLSVVPILRAGMSMLQPVLQLFPDVAVGYIGLERAHDTAVAHSYYCKLPVLEGRTVLCVDPMLATGGSAAQAVSLLKAHGARTVVMVSVIAAPEGVEKFVSLHPDVPVYAAALDRQLDGQKFIVPGLGDYGDRLYGTQ